MTITDFDIDLEGIVGEASGDHLACCREEERFLCAAPFHPEAKAEDGTPDDECCPDCVTIRSFGGCPSRKLPLHYHCPFTGRRCPGR